MARTESDSPETTDDQDQAAGEHTAKAEGIGSDTGSPGRDPDQPMSDTQRTYLEPLAASQDEEVREDMTQAEAASTIDRLQENAVHVY